MRCSKCGTRAPNTSAGVLRSAGWALWNDKHATAFCPGCRSVRRPKELRCSRTIRDIVLDHLGTRRGKPFHEVAQEVRDDWGSVSDRTVHRALARLYYDGEVRREGYHNRYLYTRQ